MMIHSTNVEIFQNTAKRSTAIGKCVFALLLSCALMMCMTACGSKSSNDESQSGTASSSQGGPSNSSDLSQTSSSEDFYPSFNKYGELHSPDDEFIDLNIEDVEDYSYDVRGVCKDNLALVEYTTGDYNEKWNTTENEVVHFGFMDGQGNLKFSLDDIMDKYGAKRVDYNARFNEGRAILKLWKESNRFCKYVVIDDEGQEIFAFDDDPVFVQSGALRGSVSKVFEYVDGVLAVETKDGVNFYDKDGELLGKFGSSAKSAGYGYVVADGISEIVDYQGNTIATASDVALEGADESFVIPIGTKGVLMVAQERGNKQMYGVYSLEKKDWLIEPSEDVPDVEYAGENAIYVANSIEGSRGIMSTEGEWLIDPDTIEKGSIEAWQALGNGWYLFRVDAKQSGNIDGTAHYKSGLFHVIDGRCVQVDAPVLTSDFSSIAF